MVVAGLPRGPGAYGRGVTRVPAWGVASSIGAPLALIGGWTLAARLQPSGYDPVTQTISSLAGLDAAHRWVMTLGLLGTGVCQATTALALRPAARAGRRLLAVGGGFTVLVGLNPLPSANGYSAVHAVVAVGAFVALATWPLASWRRGTCVPWGLRLRVAVAAGCVLAALTGWFFGAALLGGGAIGLSERVAAGSQALWPLAVVLSGRRS